MSKKNKLYKGLNEAILKDMPTALDKLVGSGNWIFDKEERLYIIRVSVFSG